MIRRALFLGVLAGAAWWLLRRHRGGRGEYAVVGYGDGSSVKLDVGAPELERLLEVARGAVSA